MTNQTKTVRLTDNQRDIISLLRDGWNVYTTRASNSFFLVKGAKKKLANHDAFIGLIRTSNLIKGDIEGQKIPYYMSLTGRDLEI